MREALLKTCIDALSPKAKAGDLRYKVFLARETLMLKPAVLAAVVSLTAVSAAHAIHFGPAAPAAPAPPAVPGAPPPPAVPGAPPLGLAAKPHELYTVDTALDGYNPITEKYNATVRIVSNPCPHVTYDNTLSYIARDADDALAQAHDQLAKIEQDIRKSADQCPAH